MLHYWLSFESNHNTKRKKRPSNQPKLSFLLLEARQLLAADISFDLANGFVNVTGTSSNDHLVVAPSGADSISVTVNTSISETYQIAQVNQIRFYAGAGDDIFDNTTAVNTLFNGFTGNDTFNGGDGVDTVYAGNGNDDISGGGGDDYLHGGAGNDILRGDAGDDELHGWIGNDTLYGNDGDDYLAAEFQDDIVYGGAGNDYVLGSSGNDILYGGDGDDYVYGQGDDDVVHGDEGRDRVRGNNGNDQLYGGDGNDFMMSDHGDDIAFGGAGDDTIFASEGTDQLNGDEGNDGLYGEFGTNELNGGIGNDNLVGGNGADIVRGDAGDDWINGADGNDQLFGGSGVDRLLGGNGHDALHGGGFDSLDSLVGNDGADRFLTQNSDFIQDRATEDTVIQFINHTDLWVDTEIEVLERGFAKLFEATGNNVLLRDSLDTGDLRFFKYDELASGAAVNYLETHTSWYWENGEQIFEYNYVREIWFEDWDETSDWYNDQFTSIAIHELGHNWDSDLELTTASSNLAGVWDNFLSQSQWTETNPNNSSFTQSHDGQWWYNNSSTFAENYGRTNPYEDLATIWEYAFANDPGDYDSNLLAKIAIYDAVFAELS